MDISIIIPSLNGKNHLSNYLSSVVNATDYSKYETEIIVIDDNSSDDTVDFLNNNFKDKVIVVKNPRKGACSARNYGVSLSKGKYICFLDNDVLIEEDFFDKTILYFSDENIGAVTCAGYLMNDGKQIDGVKLLDFKRGFPRFTRNIMNDNLLEIQDCATLWGGDRVYYSFGMQGAYFLCRKDLYVKLGGINELFEPYLLEETDLMYKILKSGYKIAYANDTKPLHLCGGTIKSKTSERTKYLSIRNKYIFTFIHIHSKSLIFSTFINTLLKLFSSKHRKALKEVFSKRKEILEARKIEKNRSVVSDKELLKQSRFYEITFKSVKNG